jgi:hypothetical protein
VTAVDAEGKQIPVAYRSNCRRPDDSGEGLSSLLFPEGIRMFARNQREEGYEVTVEGLAELPEEMVPTWLLLSLLKFAPPSRRKDLEEVGSLAIQRAEQLRTNQIAERSGENLFVAVSPGEDEVLDLVFTMGKPLIFSRVGDEWVRSEGIGDYDYQSYAMVSVSDQVLSLYDERRAGNQTILLSELRQLGMLSK